MFDPNEIKLFMKYFLNFTVIDIQKMLENVLSRLQFSLSKNSHSKESGKPFSEISVQLKLQSPKVLGPDR